MRPERALSLRPFLERLAAALDRLPPDELKARLLSQARELAPNDRGAFLASFAADALPPAAAPAAKAGALISGVRAFLQALENGAYYGGYGWDRDLGDERAFGDESWVDEMDVLFDRAGEAFLAGERAQAAEAYGLLLGAFHLQEDGDVFCGAECPEEMVATDLGEAKARYLRALFETTPADRRVPVLLKGQEELGDLGGDAGLRAMMDADTAPLPDLERFLPAWEQAIQRRTAAADEWSARRWYWLLREAVAVRGGAQALGEWARQSAGKLPETYSDWIETLVGEGKTAEAVAAADEAARTVTDRGARAGFSDRLAELAVAVANPALALDARRRAWRGEPTFARLLKLARDGGAGDDVALVRLAEELAASRQGEVALDARQSGVLEFLCGDPWVAVTALEQRDPLGWSSEPHPGPAVFPLLVLAATGGTVPGNSTVVLAAELERLDTWQALDLAATDSTALDAGPATPMFDLCVAAIRRRGLAADERRRFLAAAQRIAVKRCYAIVSASHRGAYERAARPIAACWEACKALGEVEVGRALVAKTLADFPRHRAFRAELERCTGLRGLK